MHGGRKRSFEGVHSKRFILKQSCIMEGSKFVEREPPCRSRAALWQTCSSFVADSGGPASGRHRVGVRSGARALLVEPKPSKKLTAWKRWPARSVWSPRGRFHVGSLGGPLARGQREALAEAALVMAEQASAHACGNRPLRFAAGSRLKASLWKIATSTLVRRNSSMVAFDAFFLNGFTTADQLRSCGLRKVT